MRKRALLVSVLALSLGIVAPAAAVANPERADEMRQTAAQRAAERRQSKEQRLAEIKAEVDARKLELSEARCEAREAKLKELVPKLAKSANRLKMVMDKKYEQVQEFYASGRLTVENYEELVAAIELAKANAEQSLEALASYQIEVDCTQNGLGGQLDAYRTAVKETRDELKEYRKALVALISSLRAEAAEANSEEEPAGAAGQISNEGGDTTNEAQ